MPPKPLGDRPMTATERTRKRRERLRKENPPQTERQKLAQARAEIERLHKAAAKAAPASDQEVRTLRNEVARLKDEVERLKAKIVKPAKVPLDPESEAVVRQIEKLKKEKKALRQEADKWLMKVRTLVPTPVKNKVAKALREETTNREIRHDALQAWNGLGLNNIGK